MYILHTYHYQIYILKPRMSIIIRQGNEEDVEGIMKIVKAVVPMMQASGNFQWDEVYPTEAAFRKDIEIGQCYVAEKTHEDGLKEVVGVAALTEDQSEEYADCGDLTIFLQWYPIDSPYYPHAIARVSRPSSMRKEMSLHENGDMIA